MMLMLFAGPLYFQLFLCIIVHIVINPSLTINILDSHSTITVIPLTALVLLAEIEYL